MIGLLWVLLVVYATLATGAILYIWPTIEKLAARLEDTKDMAWSNNHWVKTHGKEVEELLKRQKDRETWHRDG